MRQKSEQFFVNVKNIVVQSLWLFIIIAPIFLLINWAVFSIIQSQRETVETKVYTSAESEMNNIDLYIDQQLDNIHNDIHILLDANETDAYLDEQTPETIDDYQALIYRISSNQPFFLNAMMVDTNGDIMFHVKRTEQGVLIKTGDLGSMSSVYYYSVVQNMDISKLFISQLYVKDGIPTISFIKPLLDDNETILSYLYIDYDANHLFSVLGLYTYNENSYFEFGLMNNGVIWDIEKTNYNISINDDMQFRTALLERIINNDDITVYHYSLAEQSDHFDVEDSNSLRFYVLLDMALAIQESGSLFLIYGQIIAVFINIITGVLISYIAYVIRVRKDDRLLINANMYLSVQNTDSVVIVDKHLRVIYINPAFEKLFGYILSDANLLNILKLIKVDYLPSKINYKTMTYYEGHAWNKTQSGLLLLSYLRVKKETFFAGRDKHFIGIHSKSLIEIDNYKDYIKHKEQTMDALFELLDYQTFDISTSTLMLIHINQTDIFDFAHYMQQHLDDDHVIAIPQKQYLMIYVHIEKEALKKEINYIDQLMESYYRDTSISSDFAHVFAIAHASSNIKRMHLLIEAMLACYTYAKERKHLRYLIYDPSIKTFIEREKQIENELEHAFNNNEFYLEYLMVKDLKTNQITAAEALLRWHNKRLGQVYPTDFIPVIEDSFYINKMTLMVLEKAINDFETIIDQCAKDFRISINLCQFDLNNEYMIDDIIETIQQSTIDQSHIMFEITENQYIHNIDKINETITKLHAAGMLVAVDDFGTGYTSLSLLKSIKADVIKIDRSYIKNYPSEDDGQMLTTLVNTIHRFNKPIIIEGVETKEHMDYCLLNNCEYMQGYYISKPLTIDILKKKFCKKF